MSRRGTGGPDAVRCRVRQGPASTRPRPIRPRPVRQPRGLHPVVRPQFRQQPADLPFDRALADVEGCADVGVGQPSRDQPEHLQITFRERVQYLLFRRRDARRLPRELVQDPPGHRRVQCRLPLGDLTHGAQQLLRGRVLEEESADAGLYGLVHVLVRAERREDQHPWGPRQRPDLPGRRQPVHPRHPDVDQRHVRAELPCGVHGAPPVPGLGDDVQIVTGLDDVAQPAPYDLAVVGDQDMDHHAVLRNLPGRARTRPPSPPLPRSPPHSSSPYASGPAKAEPDEEPPHPARAASPPRLPGPSRGGSVVGIAPFRRREAV